MENEQQKRDRFLKVAETRTNKIISMIRLLGNCANENNYLYSEKEVKKIFDAIESELKTTKSKFYKKNNKKFKLGDDN